MKVFLLEFQEETNESEDLDRSMLLGVFSSFELACLARGEVLRTIPALPSTLSVDEEEAGRIGWPEGFVIDPPSERATGQSTLIENVFEDFDLWEPPSKLAKMLAVYHCCEVGGYKRTKYIGVFLDSSSAKAAIDDLQLKPGFKDCPNSFVAHAYAVNSFCWDESRMLFDA